MDTHTPTWLAGAAEADLTPTNSQFLFGYPHVKRYSAGVHDPLLASALFISDGSTAVIFIGCDVIWVPKALAARARVRIERLTGVPAERVMITATHTHSGPVTTRMLSNEGDNVVPPPDPAYLERLEQGIVQAAQHAWRTAKPARLSFGVADTSALGTNRRDPAGPAIPTAPVLVARSAQDDGLIGVMAAVSMHPTVLHEDWQLISGDFPGLARRRLQQGALGRGVPFVYHMGASGDQSPRHVVRGNTIDEAERLGGLLADAVTTAIAAAEPLAPASIRCGRTLVDLPRRRLPAVAQAEAALHRARERLASLQRDGAPRAEVRTAECDLFGAEETLTLARAAADERIEAAAAESLPAEVQAVALGDRVFVGWPGEVFVDFALRVMQQAPNAAVITLANGELQGYLVTEQAAAEGGYEAANAIFASPESGDRLVKATLDLIRRLDIGREAACPAP